MAKRFTDTNKWDDDWYLALPPRMKCVWQYLCDSCDGAGFKKVSFAKLSNEIGEVITREEFDRCFADRVHWASADMAWVHGFIRAQYRTLAAGNPAHLNIARLVVRQVSGQPLGEKARAVLDRLAKFLEIFPDGLHPPVHPLEHPPQPPSDPCGGHDGHRIKDKRISSSEGGVGETQSPPAELRDAVNACLPIWGATLEAFKIRKDPRLDEFGIGRLVRQHGLERTRLALLGARFEEPTKTFTPSKHCSLRRVGEHFEKFENLGAQNQPVDQGYVPWEDPA